MFNLPTAAGTAGPVVPPITPAESAILVNLQGSGWLDLGGSLPLTFSGTAPFTVEGWIRIHHAKPSGTQTIFCKPNEFVFCVDNGVLHARTQAQTSPCNGTTPLVDKQWFYVAVTFDGITMSVYVDGTLDGALVPSPYSTPTTSSHFAIGGNDGNNTLHGDVSQLVVSSVARTADEMYRAPGTGVPLGLTVIASYDCTQVPPVDVSGNANPIVLESGALSQTSQPGLLLQDTAYAQPTDTVSFLPGPNGAYTIEGWFNVERPAPGPASTVGVLYANMPVPKVFGPALVMLYVSWYGDDLTGQVGCNHGGGFMHSNSLLQQNGWYHLAVTFDGETLSLYINGNLDVAAPFGVLSTDGGAKPLIGAVAYGDPPEPWDFTRGIIQYLSVWNVCCTAQQIEEMVRAPVVYPGLLANFCFLGAPAVDTTNGNPVDLLKGAKIVDLRLPASPSGSPASSAPKPRATRRGRPAHVRLAEQRPTPCAGHAGAPRGEASLAAYGASMHDILARSLPPDATPELRDSFHRRLDEKLDEIARHPERHRPPRHTTTQNDGETVITCHFPDGDVEIYRGAEVFTPCQEWVAVFITVALVGLAGALGFPRLPVGDFVAAMVLNGAVFGALNALFIADNNTIGAGTILQIGKVFYEQGFLKTMMWTLFETARWWLVVYLSVFFVSLLVPAAGALRVANFLVSAAITGRQLYLLYWGVDGHGSYAEMCPSAPPLPATA